MVLIFTNSFVLCEKCKCKFLKKNYQLFGAWLCSVLTEVYSVYNFINSHTVKMTLVEMHPAQGGYLRNILVFSERLYISRLGEL